MTRRELIEELQRHGQDTSGVGDHLSDDDLAGWLAAVRPDDATVEVKAPPITPAEWIEAAGIRPETATVLRFEGWIGINGHGRVIYLRGK